MKRMMLALGAAATMSLAAVADDPIWVDAANYGKSGLTGATKALAYGTIQDAIDNAAAGATIRVLPGVYDKFGAAGPKRADTYATPTATPSRVVIDKSLKLIAEDKTPGATVIKGSYATASGGDITKACGEGAVSCIGTTQWTTRIEGFTLEDGATLQSGKDDRPAYGGAVYGFRANATVQGFLVIDCTIRNCAAGWGVVFGATCIRCTITDCYSPTSSGTGGLFRQDRFFNCLVSHNTAYNVVGVSTYAVNTTFADNYASSGSFARNNTWLYNCIVLSSGSTASNLSLNDHGVTSGYPVMATATDDWRIRSGSGAETAGTTNNLSVLAEVPAEDRFLDLNRNPIPQMSETIAVGAVQTAVTAAGGGIVWSANKWTIDGVSRFAGSYAFPAVYPTQYLAKVQLASGTYLMRYKFGSFYIPAEMDDTCWMMPAPDPAQVDTVVWEQTKTVLWVDDAKGDDSTATGTEALPYKSIQAAVSKAASGSRIHVKKGTYATGGGYGYACSNRIHIVNKTLRLIGVDGAKETIVMGASDPTTTGNASMPGCGDAAMRCVYVGDGYGQLQGFTLKGGRTAARTCSIAEGYRGGAVWMAGSGPFYITDCIISDCRGGTWGVVRTAPCLRCRFENCHAYDSLFHHGAALTCCDFAADCWSEFSYKGVAYNYTFHCSFAGNSTVWPYSEDDDRTHVGDVVGCGCVIQAKPTFAGCVFGALQSLTATSGFTKADPLFVDSATTDLRVLANSAVFTAGEAPTTNNYGATYYKYMMTSDIDGNRIVFKDGKPVAGAHMKGVPGVNVVAANGGLAVTDGKVGVNALETPAASITLSPSWVATRPCIGFTVGGVTNLFDEMAVPYAITGAELAGDATEVRALYTSDWYVDAESGSDAASRAGFTPKTAFFTLTNAMSHAVSGDTVHALPGVYSNGTELAVVSSDTIRSRVVVKRGVTLTADGGPDVTVIEGAAATADPDSYGCGADAVRCAHMMQNTNVRGFTLRGGRVASGNKNANDCSGGAVLGFNYSNNGTMLIENCTITNCVANRGAGGRYGTYVNCRFFDNRQHTPNGDGSCGTYDAAQYGCVFDRNIGYSVVYGEAAVVNCTVAAKNTAPWFVSTPNVPGCVKNTIVMGPTTNRKNSPFYRCLVLGNGLVESEWADGTRSVTAAEMAFDDNYAPQIGANAAIDAANPEYAEGTLIGATDAFGGQRVYNGALDIGAVEADWRSRYARDIRGSRLTVLSATTNVVENLDRTIRVNAGEELTATLAAKGVAGETYTLAFTVNPDSVFTVTVNGVEHVYDTAGAQTLKIAVSESENALAFACSSGSADIGRLRGNLGTVLFLR